VSPSLSVVASLPSVGPEPVVSTLAVTEVISLVPSPSASWINPARVTSPMKIPVSAPDSTSLYVGQFVTSGSDLYWVVSSVTDFVN